MTKNLDSLGLKSIADHYDLFFIDLWGVIHNGINLYEDSVNVLQKLTDKKNKKLIDLQDIQDKLENKNFILKAPEQIVTQFKNQEQEIKYSIEKIEQIIDTIN